MVCAAAERALINPDFPTIQVAGTLSFCERQRGQSIFSGILVYPVSFDVF
jgi:hypothetical protein